MTGEIMLLLARATGPARFRAELRRQTRRVRTYRAAFAPLAQARAMVPRSVLGGELLDLLSRQLRAMLLNAEEPAAGPASIPAARAGFPAATDAGSRHPSRFSVLPSGQAEPNEEFRPAAGALGASPGVFASSLPSTGMGEVSWFSASQDGTTTGAGREIGRAPSPGGRVPPAWPERSPGTSADVAPRQTAFTRALADYWRRAAESARPEAAENRTTADRGIRPERRSDVPGLPDGMLGTRSWPELAGADLAERIQAFTRGSEAISRTVMPGPVPPPGSPERAEITTYFQRALSNDGGPGTRRELADQLADVLREQAIQHGIDIT